MKADVELGRMSSIELTDDVYSSEDEDVILANMQTRSGLPQKGHGSGKDCERKTMQTDTVVATVKMSGVTMKQGVNLYDTDSEDEDIMNSLTDNFSKAKPERIESTVSKKSQFSVESVNTTKTLKSTNSPGAMNIDPATNGDTKHETTKKNVINGLNSSNVKLNDTSASSLDDTSDLPVSQYKDARFNPFDRDLHMEEDHFEANNSTLFRNSPGRLKSGIFLNFYFLIF